MADTPTVPPGLPDRPEYMLTTMDNPYDPFTQFDEWLSYDMQAGHNTAGMLARIARDTDELSDGDQHMLIQEAIDEIVRENVSTMWMKVKRGDIQPTNAPSASAT